MIKVSHEVPEILLERSRDFNDYDYALVHLFKDNPNYKQFFKDSLKRGRKVLLDNSVFELDTPFDPDAFVEAINDLAPTWYIVPDFLDDKNQTISSMEKWIKDYLPKIKVDSKIIGSIQGKTPEELEDCYIYMSLKKEVSKIAITFNSKAYEYGPGSYLEQWRRGRVNFITRLVDKGLWNMNKPHHLLGCSFVNEFAEPLYHRISIETLDTSNPIIYGLKKEKYTELGNVYKPKDKLCDLLKEGLSEEQEKAIMFNVNNFKNFSGRLDY